MRLPEVRPHEVFALLGDAPVTARFLLPFGLPSPLLIDSALLITLMHVSAARTVLEIGTFRGQNTLNFAMNLPEGGRVFTLDLDAESWAGISSNQPKRDREISAIRFEEPPVFVGTEWEDRITPLFGDSRTYDYSGIQPDLVYVDGGHDYATVRADTEGVLALEPACVVWHDYDEPNHPEVTQYLEELDMNLKRIGDTTLAYYLSD